MTTKDEEIYSDIKIATSNLMNDYIKIHNALESAIRPLLLKEIYKQGFDVRYVKFSNMLYDKERKVFKCGYETCNLNRHIEMHYEINPFDYTIKLARP